MGLMTTNDLFPGKIEKHSQTKMGTFFLGHPVDTNLRQSDHCVNSYSQVQESGL